MIRQGRRAVLGGLAASAALAAAPALARRSDGDAELLRALDAPGSYAERLALLQRFDPRAFGPSRKIDLRTVRDALAIDVALSRLVPGGKGEGPYRLPPADQPGLWRHANGARAYRLLLERQLGMAVEPEDAHRRFEREIARLSRRADALMRGLGFASGSVAERYRAMFADSRWHYPDNDSGRDQAVADMNRWLDRARSRVATLIGPVPAECLDVRARRMTRADEAAGKGGYRDMPAAGRPGAYFVDLEDIARRPRWSLASVAHHELLPGHMIQGPIEAAANPHPQRLAYLPAFSEGWAIHAEQLMAADGAYRGDAFAEIGHIHWLLFRLARGLADTGIHHRRWSLDQARAEIGGVQGVPAYFAAFGADIDRIGREPGSRAAEALAWLELSALVAAQPSAEQRRRQQQRILLGGRKPLRLLREGQP
ncbi:MAG: DUF885 family protein [Sphingomonas sp.]|uniref:DUF885 family protein n=1 Tax=Sphingomonas sp. TaxID=28214 RepID=UPI001B131FD2|nr:DUF885 family protein [Sphingomonas sp.]MBO9624689.1 DUF885 family protein [Sphingomonas sp.]